MRFSPPNIPLLLPAISLAVGIIAGLLNLSIWFVAVPLLAVVILSVFRENYLAAAIAVCAIGFTETSLLVCHGPEESLIGKPMYFRGDVKTVKESDGATTMMIGLSAAGTDSASFKGISSVPIQLSVTGDEDINPGVVITFRCNLEPIMIRKDLPDEVDPGEFLLKRHVYMRGIVTPDSIVSVTEGHGLSSFLMKLRRSATEVFYLSKLSTGAKEFLNTALLGDASDLSQTTREIFSNAGLSHVLALSGLHVGLVTLVMSIALWPLYRIGRQKTAKILIILLLWLYAGISGFSPSVTRAVIMATVYLIGRLIQRTSPPFNSLCLAAIIILILDPLSLISIGFQLSFAAVASIILFSERLNPVSRRNRIPYNCMAVISVTVSAVIGTSVISALYFHTIPLMFLLSAILAALWLPFLIGLGILFLLTASLGWEPSILISVIDCLYNSMVGIATYIGSTSVSHVDKVYLPAWILLPYLLAIVCLKWFLDKPNPPRSTAFLSSVVVMVLCCLLIPQPQREPRLYLARTTYHTDLVIDRGHGPLMILSSQPQELLEILSRANLRYADYMAKRDIDSATVIPSNKFNSMDLKINCPFIQYGRKRIALLSKPTTVRGKVDYAIVSSGARFELDSIMKFFAPDTLVLAYDVRPSVRARLKDESRQISLPVIDMKERSWSVSPF